MKTNRLPDTRKVFEPAEGNTSSQMHSSHHERGGGRARKIACLPKLSMAQRWREEEFYLHPASLSLLAYIFPMSPRPISPTTKSSMLVVEMVEICCCARERESWVEARKKLKRDKSTDHIRQSARANSYWRHHVTKKRQQL